MDLKKQVEAILGISISNEELADARRYAERKLEMIIAREVDADGIRRSENYLAQLTAESAKVNRLTKITTDLMNCIIQAERQAAEEIEIKKDDPVRKNKGRPSTNYLYCIT